MSEVVSAVGLISGGLDSAVVAAYMQANYDQSYFLFADYGQKTVNRERRAFEELCDYFNPAAAEVVDLTWMKRVGKSALFEEGTKLTYANRKLEYVPFRNACLLSAGVAMAETVEAEAVMIGSTGGDTTCPDNSPAFIKAFQDVIREGTMTNQPIRLEAPLIELSKEGVVQLGTQLEAPFKLSWSCHNNSGDSACGQCTNCSSRQIAFANLGLEDPIAYDPKHD